MMRVQNAARQGVPGVHRRVANLLRRAPSSHHVVPILIALALVAAMTLCLTIAKQFVELHHVSTAYLIPVLFAAIRLGVVPAIVVAIGGVGASAFFFYPPIFDFRVHNPEQLLDLPLFIIVAMVTSQLAARAHAHARVARLRESEMRALYAFSKRLAVATDPAHIYSAIEDHLGAITGCRVVYFEGGVTTLASRHQGETVPEIVSRAISSFANENGDRAGISVTDERTGTDWLIRAVSQKSAAAGMVAINVGRAARQDHDSMRDRIESVLADAAATLDRLDVARAIGEAKLRTEAETLRAALMGSVTHGLRTPLASIMGSATVLVEAPAIKQEPRLADLAEVIREETERLDSDIQRLLDASSISSAGVRPHMAWVETSDIVNAAVRSQRRRFVAHQVEVRLSEDLPLVNADQMLVEQALVQCLDNAVKYAPRGSTIWIEARSESGQTAIAVRDEGMGFTVEEREQLFERLYRGTRARETTSGSGLGLWIARAFVVACGGKIEIESAGPGAGTVVSIVLQEAQMAPAGADGGLDE